MLKYVKLKLRKFREKSVFSKKLHEKLALGTNNKIDEIIREISQQNSKLHNLRSTINSISSGMLVGGRIKVLFLVHHIEAWDSLADVYQEMLKSSDFEPLVASINRCFPGEDDYGFEPVIHQRLVKEGIRHIRFGMRDLYEALDIIKAIKPDLIFKQSQWDADVPPAYHTHELSFARLCYVPYATAGLIETSDLNPDRDPELNSNLHRSAWRIFYATNEERKRFDRYAVRQSTNVSITGHPKVDRLIRKGDQGKFWPIPEVRGEKKTRIIWSPHHSVGDNWSNFGMFPRIYQDMLAWARSDENIEILLSCHPALKGAMSRYWGQGGDARFQDFMDEWNELDNTSVIDAGEYAGAMAASDMLISDGMSFIIEYQFFNKPVIFLERQDHKEFSISGERLIKGTHRVSSIQEAREKVAYFASGGVDHLKDIQAQNTNWLSGNGLAVHNIIDAIRQGIQAERG